MDTIVKDNVDYRLLNGLSNLVICSRCLRSGRVTPVPQVINRYRSPTNLCTSCRSEHAPQKRERRLGKLLKFPRREPAP